MKWIVKSAIIISSFVFVDGCKTDKPDIVHYGNIVEVTDENYTSLLNSDKLLILYFKMHNCIYCAGMEPVIDKIAAKYFCNITIGKVNIEDALNSTKVYGVTSFPTTFFLLNGTVVDTIVGSYGLTEVENVTKKYVGLCE